MVIFVGALGLATVAAIRGTWSPCGQSMLSSITPLSEAGRGYRYRSTAVFFIAGALVAGAVMGALAAAFAAVVDRVGVPTELRLGVLVAAALVGVVIDAGFTPWRTPFFHRQVNENWLSQFRSWVYGAGFGFQIGSGVMTYIMTTAVFVTIGAAVLTASPWRAFSVLVLFGAVRGSAILLTSRVRSFGDLQALHRRFERWREPARRVTIASLGAAAALWAAGIIAPWAAGIVAMAVAPFVLTARPGDPGTNPALAEGASPRPPLTRSGDDRSVAAGAAPA